MGVENTQLAFCSFSSSVGAAITNPHRLGGFNKYFSQFWKLASPRSRCQQTGCLVETPVVVWRVLTFPSVLTRQNVASYHDFMKGTDPIQAGSALRTSSVLIIPQRPCLLVQFPWDRLSAYEFGGTQAFSSWHSSVQIEPKSCNDMMTPQMCLAFQCLI